MEYNSVSGRFTYKDEKMAELALMLNKTYGVIVYKGDFMLQVNGISTNFSNY